MTTVREYVCYGYWLCVGVWRHCCDRSSAHDMEYAEAEAMQSEYLWHARCIVPFVRSFLLTAMSLLSGASHFVITNPQFNSQIPDRPKGVGGYLNTQPRSVY